jgi:hypothetical protein
MLEDLRLFYSSLRCLFSCLLVVNPFTWCPFTPFILECLSSLHSLSWEESTPSLSLPLLFSLVFLFFSSFDLFEFFDPFSSSCPSLLYCSYSHDYEVWVAVVSLWLMMMVSWRPVLMFDFLLIFDFDDDASHPFFGQNAGVVLRFYSQ